MARRPVLRGPPVGRGDERRWRRVGALHGAPGVELGRAALLFLDRVPADGGRVEDHSRAAQSGRGAASGYTGPSQISTEMRPKASKRWESQVAGVK